MNKMIFLLMVTLTFANCSNKEINIYKNQTDSFPKYLINRNGSLYDYMKDSVISFNNKDKDIIHYKDFYGSEETLIFQKTDLNDFGFRSDKILISFEKAEETNGINFNAEISKYEFLYIKYYNNDGEKFLKIELENEDKNLLKTLFSNINQYKQEYAEEVNKSIFADEKLLIVYDGENGSHTISGDLSLMPEQLMVFVAVVDFYINAYPKKSDNMDSNDLPSYKTLEYYIEKTKTGFIPEPEPLPL